MSKFDLVLQVAAQKSDLKADEFVSRRKERQSELSRICEEADIFLDGRRKRKAKAAMSR